MIKAHHRTVRRTLRLALLNVEVGVAALVAAAYTTVFAISKSLIIDNSDLRTFVLSAVHSREALQMLPGATADFQRSLGKDLWSTHFSGQRRTRRVAPPLAQTQS